MIKNINKSNLDSNVKLHEIECFIYLIWEEKMDLEEVYLRQIIEQLKLQNKLKEDSNELLKAILDKLGK